MITHIDLDHFIFGWRFILFKALFPLKIKLLSLRIGVEWLNVFALVLIGRCHMAKRFLKTTPTLISESQLDKSEDCDGRDSSVSDSDWGDRVIYPNPLCVRS